MVVMGGGPGSAVLAAAVVTKHSGPALVNAVWAIPALPIAAFVVLAAAGRRIGEPRAGWLATGAMAGSFVASVLTWIGLRQLPGDERHVVLTLFAWLPVANFHVDIGVLVDPLSVTMCLFVTFVGALIFLYSIGYMHGDPDYPKFFLYLSFFAMSMLVLVLGSSMLVTFLGWEGVGAASYFLIGYWFQDIANSVAGKKAFVTNRVGDFGFMVAMFFSFAAFGTLNYQQIFYGPHHAVAQTTYTAITVLILLGAAGKSAQLPLYLWLPDAMAGPTPVSALMHAATMVTAGVFLLVRMNPVIAAATPWASTLIAWVGVGTALFAATIAISQRDVKKVLAYSTVSQLGYMVLACGCGAYSAAIFHMITHAFFKALLFLGAGSVIHGMNNEQDMEWMGGLRKYFPITSVTFIIAWLAIAGVPPFSGLWSKGEILDAAWQKSHALWAIGVFTALLTAYYMSREVYLVFFGERRWTEFEGERPGAQTAGVGGHAVGEEASEGVREPVGVHAHAADSGDAHPTVDEQGIPLPTGPGAPHHVVHGAPVHPHESPPTMTIPLIVLASGALLGGLFDLPASDKLQFLNHWLEPSLPGEVPLHLSTLTKWWLEIVAVVLVVIGIAVASAIYLGMKRERQRRYEPEILANSWYYDIAVSDFIAGPGMAFFTWVTDWFDRYVIDGAVNGVGWIARMVGQGVRRWQTGYVRSYGLTIAAAVIVLIAFVLVRANF